MQDQRIIMAIDEKRTRQMFGYSDKLLDHFEHPRNIGTFDESEENVVTGMVGSPACGDTMRLQVKIDPETERIIDVKFKTYGCGSAVASTSLLTEWIKGKTLSEAMEIRNVDIAKELDLPPIKIHCSLLAQEALQAVHDNWEKMKAGEPVDVGGEMIQTECSQRREMAKKEREGKEGKGE
jgi:nitrogen fixation NifU-like protein